MDQNRARSHFFRFWRVIDSRSKNLLGTKFSEGYYKNSLYYSMSRKKRRVFFKYYRSYKFFLKKTTAVKYSFKSTTQKIGFSVDFLTRNQLFWSKSKKNVTLPYFEPFLAFIKLKKVQRWPEKIWDLKIFLKIPTVSAASTAEISLEKNLAFLHEMVP